MSPLILVTQEKRQTSARKGRPLDASRYYDEVEDVNSNVEKQNNA